MYDVHKYNFYKMTHKMQLCRKCYCTLTALRVSSDIFAHHLENLNCITASGITHECRGRCWRHGSVPTLPWYQPSKTYVCNTRSCNTVWMLLIMSENIARNMYSSQGIINYPTQLHLVSHFRILYDFLPIR